MSRKLIALCGAAAVLTGGAIATPATALPAGHTPAVVAAVKPDVRTMYVAATHTGTTARLQLINRATGATVATVASTPMLRTGNPFRGATIAPDGTVWAVKATPGFYGSAVVRVSGGRMSTFMPYGTSVRVSPDGRRVAMTVLSPDVNHDGKGTMSVRVAPTTGRGAVRTIDSGTFPVGRDGMPQAEVGGMAVDTWLGNHHLAVSDGCCGGGSVSVAPVDVATKSWPGVEGDSLTGVVAKVNDSTALVPVAVYHQSKDSTDVVAYDIVQLSPTHPRGVKVARIPATGWRGALTRYVAAVHAVPTSLDVTSLRYRPVATLDYQFAGR